MSDRDELAALIDQYTPAFDNTHDDSVACADAILAAGWRRSIVTAEQSEALAGQMAYRSWQIELHRMKDVDQRYWRACATEVLDLLGLSVAEVPDEGLS